MAGCGGGILQGFVADAGLIHCQQGLPLQQQQFGYKGVETIFL